MASYIHTLLFPLFSPFHTLTWGKVWRPSAMLNCATCTKRKKQKEKNFASRRKHRPLQIIQGYLNFSTPTHVFISIWKGCSRPMPHVADKIIRDPCFPSVTHNTVGVAPWAISHLFSFFKIIPLLSLPESHWWLVCSALCVYYRLRSGRVKLTAHSVSNGGMRNHSLVFIVPLCLLEK